MTPEELADLDPTTLDPEKPEDWPEGAEGLITNDGVVVGLWFPKKDEDEE